MPENFLKYTNGRGHLVISVLLLLVGLALVLFSGDAATKAIGITLILTVQGAWFIPGAAKQVAYEVSKQLTTPLSAVSQVSAANTAIQVLEAAAAVPSTVSDDTQKLPAIPKA